MGDDGAGGHADLDPDAGAGAPARPVAERVGRDIEGPTPTWLWSPPGIVWYAVALTVLFGVLTVLVETGWRPLLRTDDMVAAGFRANAPGWDWLVDIADTLSTVLHPAVLRTALLAAALALWVHASDWRGGHGRRGRGLGRLDPASTRALALMVAVNVTGGAIVAGLVKVLTARARPISDPPLTTADGMAYPSGHACGILVAGLVLLLAARSVRNRWPPPPVITVILLSVGAVGAARLLLGVHYLSDVVGGWLLGGAWCAVVLTFAERWRQRGHGCSGPITRSPDSSPPAIREHGPPERPCWPITHGDESAGPTSMI